MQPLKIPGQRSAASAKDVRRLSGPLRLGVSPLLRFYRHGALEPRIPRPIYFSPPARAQRPDYFV